MNGIWDFQVPLGCVWLKATVAPPDYKPWSCRKGEDHRQFVEGCWSELFQYCCIKSGMHLSRQIRHSVQATQELSKLLIKKHKVMAERSWAPKGLLEFVGATKILLKGDCSHKNQLVLRRIPVGKKCGPFGKMKEGSQSPKLLESHHRGQEKCVARMVAGCDEGCCNVWMMLNNLLDKAKPKQDIQTSTNRE